MEFHQNLQTHSYDCYPGNPAGGGGGGGVSNKHCLLPLFHFCQFYIIHKFWVHINSTSGKSF